MDPLSSLRASLPSAATGSLEGSVEAVDPKARTVTVRLAGSETVVARGEGLAAGDRVQIVRDAAGAWVARPLPRPEAALGADPLLEGWTSFTSGSTVVRALRSTDPVQVRAALTALWGEIANTPGEDLPSDLRDAKARGLPPLVAFGSRSTPPGRTSIAPLALREELAPGLYRAESAGKALELTGPSGIRLGEAGLWAESQLGEILSLWVPTSVERAVAPELPARITADLQGARRILDRLGVPVSASPEDEESLKSLVRTLVRAEALLDEVGTTRSSDPSREPSARTTLPSATPSPAVTESGPPGPPPAATPSTPASIAPSLASPASPASPSAAMVRLLLDPESIEVATGSPSGNDEPEVVPVPGNAHARTDSDDPAAPPSAARPTVDAHRAPGARAADPSAIPARALGHDEPVPVPTTSSAGFPAVPSTPPPAEGKLATGTARAPEIPVGIALRVVKAWAVSEGEPSDAVLRAAIGEFPDLPETIGILAKALSERPGSFPALAGFLSEAEPETPLLGRHLSQETVRPSAAASPSSPALAPGKDLAQALVEDLGKALQQGRSQDAAILRDALGSLVAEGFDAARDPSNPMGTSPWTMPPRDGRPDGGRVVVQDRRRPRDGSPERTVVDVSMNPTGLGSVDARLELREGDLDVGFRVGEPGTARTIRENLPELRRILSELGLEPRNLDVQEGRRKAARTPPTGRSDAGGLDIRA